MRKKWYRTLLILWGAMFILCAGLGFIPRPKAAGLLTCLALLFFAPGAALCALAYRERDPGPLRLIRALAAGSLGGTLVALVLNFLTARMPEIVGQVLYGVLILVSSPMVCGQIWVLSLFCWACLLLGSHSLLRRLGQK